MAHSTADPVPTPEMLAAALTQFWSFDERYEFAEDAVRRICVAVLKAAQSSSLQERALLIERQCAIMADLGLQINKDKT